MANPLLKEEVFEKSSGGNSGSVIYSAQEAMTIGGTINKSIICLLLLGISAILSWNNPQIAQVLMFPALIGGFILAMICAFKQNLSAILAPIYAICEGIVLGFISLYFNRAYNGIVVEAVFITMTVLFCMLAAYRAGLLRATPFFKRVIFLATAGIAVFYLFGMIMSFFGSGLGYFANSSSGGAILINLIIVGIAAFNFIIDFDMIEQGAKHGAPKYMEWYCSLALMITLVWLYLEVLRLLARRR